MNNFVIIDDRDSIDVEDISLSNEFDNLAFEESDSIIGVGSFDDL